MNTPHPDLVLTDEVAQAVNDGAPVVALESTIISHGMPFPQNVEMATEVERIIREGGAVPATIAVLDGRPRIGLTQDDLHLLATSPDVSKISTRDLPYAVAQGFHGATTVAATMRLASLAGISVFVTGGLGGVANVRRERRPHRTVEDRRRGGLRRCEVDPRHRAHTRNTRNTRCSRRGVRHR